MKISFYTISNLILYFVWRAHLNSVDGFIIFCQS
jgi:hypothetical protein